jgi:hypothetical protein
MGAKVSGGAQEEGVVSVLDALAIWKLLDILWWVIYGSEKKRRES